MIETDLLIIGAGPTGLFTVFEAGLLKMKCHLIDSLPQPGGQLAEIYPKKPIYDIPGYPIIMAGELVDKLMEQIKPFNPGFTLGESAVSIEKTKDGLFIVTTNKGTQHKASSVAIAGGLGVFTPRKPPIKNLPAFEDKGVDYIVRDPEKFRDKRVVISGGGDSALDWTVFLAEVASEVSLVHRRTSFRGHLDTVDKVQELAQQGKVKLITNAEVVDVHGTDQLSQITVKQKSTDNLLIDCDHWLPLFGLTPTLGPIADWGLDIDKNAIVVDNATDYRTNIEGIYAIGDVNTYPGKLKLILCGFHEATIMVQSAFKRAFPDKKISFKYTTVMGGVGSLE
ncbi:MAG TPA: ferredoxin--NADP(+) reductase [Cryomorphaceae bacterium]|nr:ferredoxin--NADP(+) reductase [Cryomorphaceae bacterium]